MNRNVAIGEVRVSTDAQAREGVSLEMQICKIRQYCELNDLDLVGIYGDPGISGKSIKARPGMQAVLSLVAQKKVQHVVVYKLDRLARNTIETLQMIDMMDKNGVSLHSITEKLDTQSAIGRFVVRTLASLAEMEREIIGERTKSALGHLKETGARYCKDAPYGWQHVADGTRVKRLNGVDTIVPKYKRVEEPKEQACVRLLRKLHEENPGWSARKLGRELASRGYLNRDGRVFHPKSVGMMMGDDRGENETERKRVFA